MSDNVDKYVIGVHILFAIVIASVFTNFHTELFLIINQSFSFKSLMIFVTLATIILSWIGYNKRVEKRGHTSGILFIIDFIIIYFYFQMSYSINISLSAFTLTLGLIFISYLVWYPIKYKFDKEEFKSKKDKIQIGLLIISTLIIFGVYCLLVNEVITDIDMSKELDDETIEYELVEDIHWWILYLLIVLLIPFRIFDLIEKTEDK